MTPIASPVRRHAALLALAVALVQGGCRPPMNLAPNDASVVLAHQALDVQDPARPGSYGVKTLYYGSGRDKNRPEYRDSVTLVTDSVDASKLTDLGKAAHERNEYWGFTPKGFPLNARVWYPDGDGPFPLLLVVHGNHDMKDFSDPGYAYLGRLLASRGYIVASVDENFLNGSIREENDARGWVLLQHLKQWRRFNQEEGSPFRGKVDMSRIALMGHSRGGEAVGIAATFNRLDRYPDDATLTFDFGFDIRSVIAVAPVDGQYLPTGRAWPIHDVNYLVLEGSHDGDVTSFHGLRPWERVTYTEREPERLKAAVYIYRANHGQFNTVWGAHDNGPRSARILDLRTLLAPEDQREALKVFASAFLDVTLKGDRRYLPLFRDERVAGDWLPHTMYVTRFETSDFRPLATFEDDIDVTTGSEPGVRLEGRGLSTWREDQLQLRSRNRSNTSASQENQAVWLGWNRTGAEAGAPPPAYTLTLPTDLARRWALTPATTLQLMLSATDRVPPPPGGKGKGEKGEEDRDEAAPDTTKPPVSLSVEVEDALGHTARVDLGRYGPIRRPLETWILRRRDLEKERFPRHWEIMLQSYAIPLSDFVDATPGLDPQRLTAVRLVFDRSGAGEVVVDDVGFAHLDPAFWSARVP